MSDASKIWVALPDKLLEQLDNVAQVSGLSRNDVLRRAVEVYVDRSVQSDMCELMAQGYREMATLNLALAVDDEESLGDWPEYGANLPEANSRGGF